MESPFFSHVFHPRILQQQQNPHSLFPLLVGSIKSIFLIAILCPMICNGLSDIHIDSNNFVTIHIFIWCKTSLGSNNQFIIVLLTCCKYTRKCQCYYTDSKTLFFITFSLRDMNPFPSLRDFPIHSVVLLLIHPIPFHNQLKLSSTMFLSYSVPHPT